MSTHDEKPLIGDVSDTSLWVAVYRAEESERPDALFRDPLAGRLAGEKGRQIAASMQGGNMTGWTVVIRTVIIDRFITERVADGAEMVVNLGAGLDTRPYRMALPRAVKWVEVDYPHIIDLKEARLKDEKPRCELQRVKMDLADRSARHKLFAELGASSKKTVILTEGVTPYLTVEQVAELADDLRAVGSFKYWIVDYLSPHVFRYLDKMAHRRNQMRNAPFQFRPADWFAHYAAHGWVPKTKCYTGEESHKLGRAMPMPWFYRILAPFMSQKRKALVRRFSGYFLMEPK
jgi:methyltransferase (TIGR00027 family)